MPMPPRLALAHATPALAAAAALLAAACQAPSGPPATFGGAEPPSRAVVFEQPHSAPVSAGTPAFVGSTGEGRGQPVIVRGGEGSGQLGGVMREPEPYGFRR